MTKAVPTIFFHTSGDKARAHQWIEKAEWGTHVEFHPRKRTIDQNAKLHAVCTDIAGQVEWGGKKRGVEAWKDILTAALLSDAHELDIVPGINGGFVLLGLHTSSLSVAQCADLITLAEAFGAEHGVVFHDAPAERVPA